MSDHKKHDEHDHNHDDDCGHTAIVHGDDCHTCYVHDGHMHKEHDGHFDECAIDDDKFNSAKCTDEFNGCSAHDDGTICNPDCGHEAVPHGDHVGYLVPDGKGNFDLHCPHDDNHCDDHGKVYKRKPGTDCHPK